MLTTMVMMGHCLLFWTPAVLAAGPLVCTDEYVDVNRTYEQYSIIFSVMRAAILVSPDCSACIEAHQDSAGLQCFDGSVWSRGDECMKLASARCLEKCSPVLSRARQFQDLRFSVPGELGTTAGVLSTVQLSEGEQKPEETLARPISAGNLSGVARGVQGAYFSLDVSRFFTHATNPDDLVFSGYGLPAGSGLTLDSSTGMLEGFPTLYDAMAAQPLVVTVVAADSRGRVSDPVRFPVLVSEVTRAVGESLRYDVYRDRFTLTDHYAIVDRIVPPPSTGLELDVEEWLLRGVASEEAAMLSQPLSFTLTGRHRSGTTVNITHRVLVTPR